MAPHSGDKSLLDRLNALKPTSVNLDRSTNALDIPATGLNHASSAEPLSREDALTERLRSLRNRRDDNHVESDNSRRDPPPPYSPSPLATRAQPQSPSAVRATGPSSPGVGTVGSRRSGGGGGDGDDDDAAEGGSQSSGEYDHYFDDVLQPLDLDEDVSDSDGGGRGAEGGEGSSRRVEDLLAKLKAGPGAPAAQPRLAAGDSKPDESDDDSEGEAMSHEVEDVISRAMDELKLDGRDPEAGDGRGADDDGDALALPTVPQDAADDKGQEDTAASSSPPPKPRPARSSTRDDTTTTTTSSAAGLSLPAVPTALVDPTPTSGAIPNPGSGSGSDAFESSIEARLAALKGASAPVIRTDALGLPSAPTFQPEDNLRPRGRGGYTDADQKTWCIVCLEDAAVRCLGCSEDGGGGVGEVYCARCWREMHVGPSAGYDERGHAWEKFDPRRV